MCSLSSILLKQSQWWFTGLEAKWHGLYPHWQAPDLPSPLGSTWSLFFSSQRLCCRTSERSFFRLWQNVFLLAFLSVTWGQVGASEACWTVLKDREGPKEESLVQCCSQCIGNGLWHMLFPGLFLGIISETASWAQAKMVSGAKQCERLMIPYSILCLNSDLFCNIDKATGSEKDLLHHSTQKRRPWSYGCGLLFLSKIQLPQATIVMWPITNWQATVLLLVMKGNSAVANWQLLRMYLKLSMVSR